MIRNLGSLYSFIQESIQGKISKSTPTKAIPVKKRLLEMPDPQIGSSVIACRLTSERGNNDNLDQYLNKDNLPLGGLQVKIVYKISS